MSNTEAVATTAPDRRMRRGTACVSCRDAKVRCNPSLQPSQPCQRCAKLHLDCVVDKSHKRMSRKSKLEELVQEIQTIKQTVGVGQPVGQSVELCGTQISTHKAVYPQQQVTTPFRDPESQPFGIPSPGVNRIPPSSIQTPATTLVSELHIEPSLPRALGSQPFSGEDIDYYFGRYFEHFHPYMPIVRHRDPNKCYESGSILFWTIILTACRRYAKNDQVFPFLIDAVRRELFSAISVLPLTLPAVNSLILICTWVFPNVRFVNDPTPLFSSVAMNTSLLLGIHLGKGSIPEFGFGVFRNDFSDEEASYTWSGYNIVSQRVSACMGLPPLGCLFNQTIQNIIDGKTQFQVPSSFRVLLECQKFSHRLSKTMAAFLDESRGVSAQIVQQLEDEFDMIRGLICSERADDLDRFNALLVLQEIQAYYLMPLPGYDSEGLKRNISKAYTTAQTVITEALDLEKNHGFLKHLPHFYFRSILLSICIIFKTLRSSYVDFLGKEKVRQRASDAISVCRASVVTEADLPHRLANLLESFWALSQTTKWHEEPTSIFHHRLGASVTFDCLKRWKDDMQKRPKCQPPPSEVGEPPLVLGNDALTNIDWSFLDDFDWNLEPILP